jgi:RES domain-containing protein
VSTVTVWRLCTEQYGASAFDGEGARLFGGRWSPPGISLAYCAESRSLAVLEVLANLDAPASVSLRSWVFVSAEIPLDCIEKPERFPVTWRQFPHARETQLFGRAWAREGRSAALRVPSAVVGGEFNYLLNPAHPDFARITIGQPEAFAFDPRLAR